MVFIFIMTWFKKLNTQVNRFYLASFLKNQTYFVPIIVLFFQDIGLSYSQIFWVFTIGAAFSFIIEIPTGIIADLFGQRRSIIFSKFFIFLAFIAFGLSRSFVALLIANLIYELGKSFRSGTETAYVFNYLNQEQRHYQATQDQKHLLPSYTKIKINQKFYARLSESLAAITGGWVAYRFGFNLVFFLAAIPALFNWLQTLTWVKLDLESGKQATDNSLKNSWQFLQSSWRELRGNRQAIRVILNISFFSAALAALDKFVQPYMKLSGIELQNFGLFYSAFLIIIAFLVKFAAKLEDRWGGENIMNYSGILVLMLLILITTFPPSIWLAMLFFVVLMIDNLRSPVANNLFHELVPDEKRATLGSILEMVESVNKLWILPVIGYLADLYTMNVAILLIGALISLNVIFLRIPRPRAEKVL